MRTAGPAAVLIGGSLVLAPVHAQSPTFETVSIERNTSRDAAKSGVMPQAGGRLTARNVTLRQLIDAAYRRHGFDRREISGGPPWIDSARFDLEARAAREHTFDPDGFPRETWLMLRMLLDQRFGLQLRTETGQVPSYALMMARSDSKYGPRLRKSDIDCGVVMAMLLRGERPSKPVCGSASYPGRLVGSALTLPAFAAVLSGIVGRPVIDRTELTGNFDFEVEAVEIRPQGPFGPSYRPSATTQSIFEALPEQLGLKLEATNGAVEVLVVESAELPVRDKERP